jgi:hypothetical protein
VSSAPLRWSAISPFLKEILFKYSLPTGNTIFFKFHNQIQYISNFYMVLLFSARTHTHTHTCAPCLRYLPSFVTNVGITERFGLLLGTLSSYFIVSL